MTKNDTGASADAREKGRRVLLGPPGLFLWLTLASLAAGLWIARSSDAGADSRPAPAAAARP